MSNKRDFLGDDHRKGFAPDFDDSGVEGQKEQDGEQIEEMVNTNNFYTYDETNQQYDPRTHPFSYFYADICG